MQASGFRLSRVSCSNCSYGYFTGVFVVISSVVIVVLSCGKPSAASDKSNVCNAISDNL